MRRRTLFADRSDAGRTLARQLAPSVTGDDIVVLALPRGGVPVAAEVADAFQAPLDVIVVRKVGVPGHEEVAMGAVGPDGPQGTILLDRSLVARLGLDEPRVRAAIDQALREMERREHDYRSGRPRVPLDGRTVIVVDDGLATGASMVAALTAIRRRNAARIVVAVPLAAAETITELRGLADDVVVVATPQPFGAVGLWYDDFSQTTDAEVRRVLARHGTDGRAAAS